MRFIPRANGVHWVDVRHKSGQITASPFRCIVGSRECDVSLVTAGGRGLTAGHTGIAVCLSVSLKFSTTGTVTRDYIVAKIHIDYRGNSYRRVTSVLLGGQEEGGGVDEGISS